MKDEMNSIRESIRAASWLENFLFAKVLHMTKSREKAKKQTKAANEARQFLHKLYKNQNL